MGSADEPTGTSRVMQALRRRIHAVARAGSTILLTGETGTGKGLVARAIHQHSPRRERAFLHVDCASLAATVIESELFGHERGAFTGAVERRCGRFEQAGDGTIFLDEIGELSPALQSKLLRVLQDREFERLGGARTLCMGARVIAATSCDLEAAVRDGGFRVDLYYRLAVVEVRIPPLRERLEDLPELVGSGLQRLARPLGRPAPEVESTFCERLRQHPWAGNVRELLNLLERILVEHPGARLDGALADEALGAPLSSLGPLARPDARPSSTPSVSDTARDDLESISEILLATGGNVARAARRLGLPRSTLRHRITRHGLGHLIPHD